MARLFLTLGCWNYDRVEALQWGRVQPDGIDLNFLEMPVEETFFRMLRHREFDACEMSLSSYCVSLMRDPAPFVAIPVFPSRMFRHGSIFVSEKAGSPNEGLFISGLGDVATVGKGFGRINQSTLKLTIFMTSHDIKESFHLGGRVIVLDRVRKDPHEPELYGARITYDLPLRRGRDARTSRAVATAETLV